MICEKKITINSLNKRFDLLIYNNKGMPEIVIECKAPSISLDDSVLQQALRYNFELKAKYIILTNGLELKCCEINRLKGELNFLNSIPKHQII